jgi:hypothetical protein
VAPAYLRALSRQFSISAPRMAVRTHLAWPWKACLAIGFIAVIAGMWWWGFDFGQFLGGFNRREHEQRIETMAADTATAQREAAELRARNTQLESDLTMMRGTQDTLQKQQAEALQENAQLKDELAFFQQFFADSTKAPGVGIQRITLEGNGSDVVRYSVLIIRGGSTKTDFDGELALQAELVPTKENESQGKALTVSLPGDAPEAASPLRLKFKYYQRVEGTLRTPPGYLVRTLTARAYESGSPSPRATRTLTLP